MTDVRKRAFCTASKQKIQGSGDNDFSGKASGCASRLNTRFRVVPVLFVLLTVSEMVNQRMRVVCKKNGDQDISCIEVVETREQIKIQRRNKVYVMDLVIDGGKKSAGFRRQGANL